ncbi:MAG TPA: glycosyltransferase family 39 protein, partial [Polyangiaceae bacterium]
MSERETPASDTPEPAPPADVAADDVEPKAEAAASVDEKTEEKSAEKEEEKDEEPAAEKAEASSDDKTDGEGDDEDSGVVLVPPGNPLRWGRGGVTAAIGLFLAFLVMANSGQLRWGVPLGTIFLAIAAWGIMDLVGSFDDAEKTAEGESLLVASHTLGELAKPLAQLAITFVLFCSALAGAQNGIQFGMSENVAQYLWGAIVSATFLGLVASVYGFGTALGPWKKDETGLARTLLQRHGFWVIVAGTLLYLPTLGSYSLWDPWETHYGEVAREMLSRNDWISTWWAQDGWFFSKPVLDFWIQAIAMATMGTHYKPDQML